MSATAAGARPRSAGFRLTGTGLMLRFLLRRTWARLLVWPAVVVGMTAVVVAYYKSEFDTPEALAERAVLSNSAGMKAIFGHITPTGLGGGVWSEMWMFTAVMLAIGLIFLLTRTNRADEEHGRTELLLARPIATTSGLVASVAWLTLLCVVAAAGAAVVCGAYGLEWTGSWIMGASLGGVGLTGVAVAALANQLTVTSRDANGLALGILAVFYLLRTIGDLKGNALTWLSPIGWGERMDPWGDDRWWPLVLIVALWMVCITLAIGFQPRRDYGAGLVRSRPGPVGSAGFDTTEFGLTIRLNLGAAIAWVAGMALWGVLLGSTLTDMKDLAAQLAPLSGGTGLDAIIALWVRLTALVVAALVARHLLTLRSDEEHNLVEPRLAAAISRLRLVGTRLLYTGILTLIALAVAGAAMGIVYGTSVSAPEWVGKLTVASIAYLPSLAVIAGVAIAGYGWLPRLATTLTWTVVALAWIIAMVGDALRIPRRILDHLPFTSIQLPAGNPSTVTQIAITAIAVLLLAFGLWGFHRRGIPQ